MTIDHLVHEFVAAQDPGAVAVAWPGGRLTSRPVALLWDGADGVDASGHVTKSANGPCRWATPRSLPVAARPAHPAPARTRQPLVAPEHGPNVCEVFATPAAGGGRPTALRGLVLSGESLDIVGMGLIAARNARCVLANNEKFLAVEFLATAQAVDSCGRVDGLSPAARATYDAVRCVAGTLEPRLLHVRRRHGRGGRHLRRLLPGRARRGLKLR